MSLRQIYLDELTRIQERVNGLFEQAFAAELEDRDAGAPGCWAPVVDVIETESAYLLVAELSGVRREDVQWQVKERRLELSGRRDPPGEHRTFLRMERSYGPFRRSFELAAPLAGDAVTAEMARGILRLRVPKAGAVPGGTPAATAEHL